MSKPGLGEAVGHSVQQLADDMEALAVRLSEFLDEDLQVTVDFLTDDPDNHNIVDVRLAIEKA